jgi:hypothetical protein
MQVGGLYVATTVVREIMDSYYCGWLLLWIATTVVGYLRDRSTLKNVAFLSTYHPLCICVIRAKWMNMAISHVSSPIPYIS